ncbi:MAG: VCBS repeat-containing protein, partial [Bacteroidales bacterium]|nr:VCBS repeat-containing protein [Bacteroidales bacterium]
MKNNLRIFFAFLLFNAAVAVNVTLAQTPQSLPDNVDTSECTVTPPANSFDIKLKWKTEHYTGENDPYTHGRSTPIVADMNGDGLAEVVIPWAPICDASHNRNNNNALRPNTFITRNLNVLNGKTGNLKYTIQTCDYSVHGQTIAAADVNNDGKCEIFIVAIGARSTSSQQKYDGKYVYCYDGSKVNSGPEDYIWKSAEPVEYSFIPFIADLNNDGIAEVVVGTHIFNAITGKLLVKGTMDENGMGFGGPHNVHGSWQQGKAQELGEQYYMFAVADIDGDKKLEICAGNTIYKPTINNPLGTTGNKYEILRQCENTLPYNDMYDGNTFVLDFDSDGDLDVCVLGRNLRSRGSNFTGDVNPVGLYVWEGQTSEMIGYFVCDPKVNSPSIPFAGDIDGDGYPEVIFNGWVFGQNYGAANNPDQMHVFKYEKGYTHNDRCKAMNIKEPFTRAQTQEFFESAGFTVFDFNQDT